MQETQVSRRGSPQCLFVPFCTQREIEVNAFPYPRGNIVKSSVFEVIVVRIRQPVTCSPHQNRQTKRSTASQKYLAATLATSSHFLTNGLRSCNRSISTILPTTMGSPTLTRWLAPTPWVVERINSTKAS